LLVLSSKTTTENNLPLILAVADLAYSGGEGFELLQLIFEKRNIKARLEAVPLAEVASIVQQRKPALVIIGHRALVDNAEMVRRWQAIGAPMGGDIVKALKSNRDTKDIPVLMLESHIHLEQIAKESGVDDYLKLPMGPAEFIEKVSRLVQNNHQPIPTKNGHGSPKRWIKITPAIAAGLTDHVWTMDELLSFRVPPRSQWKTL
jgi:CheY-like chemotaxis protein